MSAWKPGDWVSVKPQFDIPPMFWADGKPTRGRVHEVTDGNVEVWVPIGGADVDEHSQCVFYGEDELVAAEAPSVRVGDGEES